MTSKCCRCKQEKPRFELREIDPIFSPGLRCQACIEQRNQEFVAGLEMMRPYIEKLARDYARRQSLKKNDPPQYFHGTF